MTESSGTKTVRRNVAWNVAGQAVPLAAAVLCIPLTLKALGNERFGALSIVWTLLIYFGFLDLGLGRSLTQQLARENRGPREEAKLVWTNFAVLAVLGFAAGVFLFAASSWIAGAVLRLEGALRAETTAALRVFALGLPLLIHETALRGVLEAKRRFDLSSRVRVCAGVFSYAGPLLVLPFSTHLAAVVGVMILGRACGWATLFILVLRLLPHLRAQAGWDPKDVPGQIKAGLWYMVPTALGPLLNSMDRFFISSVLSISLVAYYVTPYEIVTKLWILSAGISGVVFAEFSKRFPTDPGSARSLMLRGLRYTLAALFPVVLVIVAYAREGLSIWLDPVFAAAAASVLRWLSVFSLVAGLGHITYAFLLGAGRARVPALLQLVELPLYAVLLYFSLQWDGIRGAAIASVIRVSLDFMAQLFFAGTLLRFGARTYAKVLLPVILGLGALFVFGLPLPPLAKALLVAGALLLHAMVVWARVLEAGDKARLRALLRRG